MTMQIALTALLAAGAAAASGQDWAGSVEVRQEETLCVTYQARQEGEWLMVRARIEPGWHTFAMDNKVRAEEKLAGKPSLGIDRQTEITLTGGLHAARPWHQTAPQDFSKPELRWFSWGFEKEALFAVKVNGAPAAPTRIAIRGQVCTETLCKNIDVTLQLPAAEGKRGATFNPVGLIPVR